jgi:type I restriction enzyme S subunit
LGYAGRFGAGLPRISDGSLLFLQHMLSKRKESDGGTRIGIVFNGSPLFSGGAGSGESEIRRWIIEKDWLEAIVALPDQLFYNTGISTYVWIVTNRKSEKRRGKVQLLNAASFFRKKVLFYWTRSSYFVDEVVSRSTGVSYPAINASEIGSLPFPIISNAKQRRIATFLDAKTAEIDELIALKQQQIALLQQKRMALISRAVTKGLDPHAPMRDSGVAWLGEVPERWEVAQLHYHYSVQLGKMLDTNRITGNHLAPYLRNVDVQWGRINIVDLPQMDFSPQDRVRFQLQKDDLLVCEGGEVGRTAIWNGGIDECYYQKAIHRLRRTRTTDIPQFMYYVMLTAAYIGVFVAEGNPNTIDRLTAEKLGSVPQLP